MGIFSTRSPHRPNPIGITLAKIEAVDMNARTVLISGVDLVDSTPVLDIKPYVPGPSHQFALCETVKEKEWMATNLSCSTYARRLRLPT